jgi:hypothetical protein
VVVGARDGLRVVLIRAKSFIFVVLGAKSAVLAGGGGRYFAGSLFTCGVSFLLVFSLDHFKSPFAQKLYSHYPAIRALNGPDGGNRSPKAQAADYTDTNGWSEFNGKVKPFNGNCDIRQKRQMWQAHDGHRLTATPKASRRARETAAAPPQKSQKLWRLRGKVFKGQDDPRGDAHESMHKFFGARNRVILSGFIANR